MNAALLSSKKMDWCTPQDFFDKLNAEFNFVLDAAATEKTKKMRSLLYAGNGRTRAKLGMWRRCFLQSSVWARAGEMDQKGV